jgi:hypothetical protein
LVIWLLESVKQPLSALRDKRGGHYGRGGIRPTRIGSADCRVVSHSRCKPSRARQLPSATGACSLSVSANRLGMPLSGTFRVELRSATAGDLQVGCTLRAGRHVIDVVGLATTLPRGGGLRWWFFCPCGMRTAKLYLPPNDWVFRCRVCHDLVYESQAESPRARWLRRSRKIAARLRRDSRGNLRHPWWMRFRFAVYHGARSPWVLHHA